MVFLHAKNSKKMKIKFNWGTGILIAILSFIGFIMYFFVKTATDKTYNHELVTEDYYNQELAFQQMVEMEKNAEQDRVGPSISILQDSGIVFSFPQNVDLTSLQGVVKFYRPSSEKLDFQLPLKIEDTRMFIPKELLQKGLWKVDILYQINQKKYKTHFDIDF